MYFHKNERNESKFLWKKSATDLCVVCADFCLEAGNQDAVHTHAVQLRIGHVPEVRNLQEMSHVL